MHHEKHWEERNMNISTVHMNEFKNQFHNNFLKDRTIVCVIMCFTLLLYEMGA
jgi:hypothetical protein